jgi:hypothetical protein
MLHEIFGVFGFLPRGHGEWKPGYQIHRPSHGRRCGSAPFSQVPCGFCLRRFFQRSSSQNSGLLSKFARISESTDDFPTFAAFQLISERSLKFPAFVMFLLSRDFDYLKYIFLHIFVSICTRYYADATYSTIPNTLH